eukprot:scaffold60928_cov68-Phaeocystis_antarctica.AAC.2
MHVDAASYRLARQQFGTEARVLGGWWVESGGVGTGRLLPTLVRALVVAPRDVPSLGVTESGPGGWNRGQGQGWVRVGVGVRVGVRAYSARSSEVVPRLASSSSMSEAWGQGSCQSHRVRGQVRVRAGVRLARPEIRVRARAGVKLGSVSVSG